MTTKTTSTPAATPSQSGAFARRGETARHITREHIDEHMAAFQAAGGVVEVLGNTPLHKPWRAATRAPAKP